MWPLVIVAINEVIKFGLLLQEIVARGPCGLKLPGQMHALMAAVLLWVTGLDALDLGAEPEPPDGELGEIKEGFGTGEGHAVIGTTVRAALGLFTLN